MKQEESAKKDDKDSTTTDKDSTDTKALKAAVPASAAIATQAALAGFGSTIL